MRIVVGSDHGVLVLGGRIVGPALAQELMWAFVAARFSGQQRHLRRLAKMKAIEARYQQSPAGVRRSLP